VQHKALQLQAQLQTQDIQNYFNVIPGATDSDATAKTL